MASTVGQDRAAGSRRALQVVVALLGAVAFTFGMQTVLIGTASVLEAGDASPNVDNELRFYAAWYASAGIVLLLTVRRVEAATGIIRGVCAALILGAAGRALSMAIVGSPHPGQVALMVVEFAIPAVIVPWQAAVARRSQRATVSTEPGRANEGDAA
jgi:hypothetical protein